MADEEFYYRQSSNWLKAVQLHYKHAGNWLNLKEMYYKHAGNWRRVFVCPPTIYLYAININSTSFAIGLDGYVSGGTWSTPIQAGANAGLEYQITNMVKTGTVIGPGNTAWTSFNSQLSWSLQSEGNVSVSFVFYLRRWMPDDGDGPYYINYGSASWGAWFVS
jgi:hypothetical protein